MTHQFLEALEKDHEKVKGILEELKDTSKTAVKTKEDLLLKLKAELIPHMRGEEKYFYAALKKKDEAKDTAREALEEHRVAETVFNELEELSKDAVSWDPKLTVFKELVEHHIEEEEDEIFETAEDHLSEQQLDQIFESFQKEKESVKQKIK